jgi:hypothetical protein
MQQNRLAAGLCLDPLGELTALPPDPLAGCRGPLRGGWGRGEEEKVGEEGWEGKGRRKWKGGRGGKGRKERKGRDADFPLQELLIPSQCRGSRINIAVKLNCHRLVIHFLGFFCTISTL